MELAKGTPQPKLTPYQGVVAYRSIELAEESTLTVISAEDRNQGTYQLVADNTAGRLQREAELSDTGREYESIPCPKTVSEVVTYESIPCPKSVSEVVTYESIPCPKSVSRVVTEGEYENFPCSLPAV